MAAGGSTLWLRDRTEVQMPGFDHNISEPPADMPDILQSVGEQSATTADGGGRAQDVYLVSKPGRV